MLPQWPRDRACYAMLQALIGGSERPAGSWRGSRCERRHCERPPAASSGRRTRRGPVLRPLPLLPARRTARRGCRRGTRLDRIADGGQFAAPIDHGRRHGRSAKLLRPPRRQAGIALRETLLSCGALSAEGARDFRLTDCGLRFLEDLGLDPEPILRSRRMLARDCLDWSERKPHPAGALPSVLLARLLEVGWLERHRNDRSLTVTDFSREQLSHFPISPGHPDGTTSPPNEHELLARRLAGQKPA